MNYQKKFYEKYVSTHTSFLYGEQGKEHVLAQFPAWSLYFNKLLPREKNAKILDIGCGDGGLLIWLAELGFKNIEGIDISKEQISLALALGVKNVSQADLFEFLNNDNKYDVIFMRDVLEHFNKEEVLKITNLVFFSLKKGGKFIIQTVNAENILWGRLRYGDFTHELAFTSQSISQVLNIAGFNKIKIIPQRPVLHGIKSAVRLFLWYIFELKMKFYLLIETGTAKGSIFTQNIIVEAKK